MYYPNLRAPSPPSCVCAPSLTTRVHTRQPDGSVHGNAHSYGPYEGRIISTSIMLRDDGNSWRLCDTPEAHALLSLLHHAPLWPVPLMTSHGPPACFCVHRWRSGVPWASLSMI